MALALPLSRTKIWRELLLVVALGAAAGAGSLQGTRHLGPAVIDPHYEDFWFEADTADFVPMMTDREGRHGETRVHPLLSLWVYPPVKALRLVFGLAPFEAVDLFLAWSAALWAGALFAVLRLIGCRRLDATVFTLLAIHSAAATFWFVVPESYPVGSLTLVIALGVSALAQHRPLAPVWYVITSAMTLSGTVTNWMAGIFATCARFPWRRALQLTVNAFCLVVVLWGVEKAMFPSAGFFLENPRKGKFIFHERAGGPGQIIPSFAFHSMVMPAIVDRPFKTGQPRLVTQPSAPGSASPWGAAAVWLWALLLGLGAWGACSTRTHVQFRRVLGLTLLGQLGLHLVYGDETFLYSLHFLPLLVMLAAYGALTRARPLVLGLAVALTVCARINNQAQFHDAATRLDQYLQTLESERQHPAEDGGR